MFIGRSTHETMAEEFAKLERRPQDLDARKKEVLKLANALKEMTETSGWKLVLEPFLRKHSNPTQLFKIVKEHPDRADVLGMTLKIEAYHNLLRLVENILSVLRSADKKEEEEPEEENSP